MKTYEKVGIIGAMPSETLKVKEKLSDVKETLHAGIPFWEGHLGDTEIILVTSGIGKVNAAIIAQILIDRYAVECIINTGIAGGMAKEVKTGDIVISSEVVFHDLRTDVEQILVPTSATPALVEAVEKICETMGKSNGFSHYTGRIATGDQFICTREEKDRIEALCHPLCVEMEGGAIGYCCGRNAVDFVIVRAISDNADEEAQISFNDLEERTATLAAAITTSLFA